MWPVLCEGALPSGRQFSTTFHQNINHFSPHPKNFCLGTLKLLSPAIFEILGSNLCQNLQIFFLRAFLKSWGKFSPGKYGPFSQTQPHIFQEAIIYVELTLRGVKRASSIQFLLVFSFSVSKMSLFTPSKGVSVFFFKMVNLSWI